MEIRGIRTNEWKKNWSSKLSEVFSNAICRRIITNILCILYVNGDKRYRQRARKKTRNNERALGRERERDVCSASILKCRSVQWTVCKSVGHCGVNKYWILLALGNSSVVRYFALVLFFITSMSVLVNVNVYTYVFVCIMCNSVFVYAYFLRSSE